MSTERGAPIEAMLGELLEGAVASTRPVSGGYSHAWRRIVALRDGRTAFVKVAVDDATADWLRAERRAYEALAGAPFMARVLGWRDDESGCALALEDLSRARWPPPWRPGDVEAVRETLRDLSGRSIPGVHRLGEDGIFQLGWREVLADPGPFLGLGLATPAWLEAAGPTLLAAQRAAKIVGDDLLLCDVRSDNLCLRDDPSAPGRPRVTIVDWNWACLGDARFDVAFWLPSLAWEGGPAPESILPDAGDYAALVSGFFARQAGLPPIPEAPRVRWIQQVQLSTSLPWAVRALGLPPLDGPRAELPVT